MKNLILFRQALIRACFFSILAFSFLLSASELLNKEYLDINVEEVKDFNYLSKVLQAPIFSSGWIVFQSGDQIVEKLRQPLMQHLQETNYDRIHIKIAFLDHYEKSKKEIPTISPLQSLANFNYDFSLKESRGGPCVGLTFDLLNRLPSDVSGYIVAAKLPRKYHQFAAPEYCHTAVIIAFSNPNDTQDNGFVLLDPHFDIHEPILLRRKDPHYQYQLQDKGLWTFSLIGDEIICEIKPQKSHSVNPNDMRMVYRTDRVLNPIQCSAIPMMIIDRRLSLLARKADGKHLSHLNIELDKHRIIRDQDGEILPPISFEDFESGSEKFNDSFAEGVYLSSNQLNAKVARIIQQQNIIDCLYWEYLKLLETTQDRSITGPLNSSALNGYLRTKNKSIGKELESEPLLITQEIY